MLHIAHDGIATYYVLDVEQRRAMRAAYGCGQDNAPENGSTEAQRHASGVRAACELLESYMGGAVENAIVDWTVSYYGA